jgi:D-alanyl-D-alanine carboxypeptidase
MLPRRYRRRLASLPVRRTTGGLLAALLWLVVGLAGPAAGTPTQAAPASTTSSTAPPPPKAYILVDANTGSVLAASNERVPRPPASLTKVLTALAASAALPHDGTLPISARAAAQPANKVGAKEGQIWPIEDAMHVLLMQSANDIALAFAEAVGGTAEGFQDALARTAAAIGMDDPQTWRDPAGLDDEHSVGGGNLVSARDLAIAGRAMIADPWLSPISAKPKYRFTAPDGVVHETVNHNKLVLGRYAGAIGGKTGYTRKAGNSLFASAQRNGRTMVAVVMDTKDAYGFTSSLFDRGFATPVDRQKGLDQLPPLRLPTAAKVKPPVVAAPAPALAPDAAVSPADAAAAPTPALDVTQEQRSGRDTPLEIALEPTATEVVDRFRLGVALLGAALGALLLMALGRGLTRRRRERQYYQVPARRPSP